MIPISLPLVLKLIFKAAPYAVGVAIVGLLLWSVYSWDQGRLKASYKEGYAAREAIAVKAERDLLKEKERVIAARIEREKIRKDQDKKRFMEVIDAERERNEKLQRDIADLGNKRMFVNVKAKPAACDRAGMPGGGDTGIDAGGTERAELSTETQRDIQRLGVDAEQLVNKYLTLVDLIEKSQGECLKIVE